MLFATENSSTYAMHIKCCTLHYAVHCAVHCIMLYTVHHAVHCAVHCIMLCTTRIHYAVHFFR